MMISLIFQELLEAISVPPGMPATFELKEEAVPKETGRRVEERPLFGEGELATNYVEHH